MMDYHAVHATRPLASNGVPSSIAAGWTAQRRTCTPSMRVVRTLWCCSAMLVRLQPQGGQRQNSGIAERMPARRASQTSIVARHMHGGTHTGQPG